MKSQQNHHYVGCDVAKAKIDVDSGSEKVIVSNDAEGFAKLFRKLRRLDAPMLVLEHTGIYGNALCEAAEESGIAFARVDPKKVRHFAKSEGRHAKTDPLDAQIIRRFAEEKRPAPQRMPSKFAQKLRQLRNTIDLLSKNNAELRCQLEATEERFLRKTLEKVLSSNEKTIRKLEEECGKLLRSDTRSNALFESFTSVRGVGAKTASTLIATLPELGSLPRGKIAALAGVAPFDSQSGRHVGVRSCRDGRVRVRCALYMAALSAVRSPESPLHAQYLRLRSSNKPFKVALVACMRKLLIHLNSLARNTLKNFSA